MTTPRISRAGRSRFFIGIVALLLMIGFVAIFHSSQQQLDESRQLRLRCEQQQEVLNARIQAIVEHKFRLEKSLEVERKEHMDTRKSLEKKAKEQREQHTKASMESNIRLESLQQHYKLLESEHLDLKEQSEKTRSLQLAQINGLDRKVSMLQGQLKVTKQQKENDVLHWKMKYESAETERKRLEILVKNDHSQTNCHQKVTRLEKMLAEYKTNCEIIPPAAAAAALGPPAIPLSSERTELHTASTRDEGVKSAIEKSFKEQLPIAQKPLIDEKISEGDNNLQQPPPLKAPIKSSSTVATNLKTPDMKNAGPLPLASVVSSTSEKLKKSSSTAANDRNKELYKSLGVAPIPENFEMLIKNEEHNQSGGGGGNNNNNNRYANVVDELSGKKDEAEQDNAAHEVKDNDFNLADDKNEPKDHLQEVLDNMNNAAEDDTNNFFDTKLSGRISKKENGGVGDEDDVEVIGGGGNKHEKVDGILEGDDKLINEVVGDQGKVAFPEGLHLEEAVEEDDDDYSNPAARQQEGPAVRN